jgi:SMI1/KNR4 family protein SUKH-1
MFVDETAFYDRQPGLDPSKVSEVNAFVQAPLTDGEITHLAEYPMPPHAPPPSEWRLEIRDLPSSYVELLLISHGGGITKGEREIGFFGKHELREYLLEYQFPVYMPGALPFGLNGGGVFYIFDMRRSAENGEYPILVASSGNLCYDDAVVVASSVAELLSDPTNVEDLLYS